MFVPESGSIRMVFRSMEFIDQMLKFSFAQGINMVHNWL
jgi:hypothetical protein